MYGTGEASSRISFGSQRQSFAQQVPQGSAIGIDINIQNLGFAAPVNPRDVVLSLVSQENESRWLPIHENGFQTKIHGISVKPLAFPKTYHPDNMHGC